MLDFQKSIRLAEKRLFPLNYTPKRPQSLKKTDFVPVADFSSQEVGHTVPLGLEGCSKFKELLAAGAPRHPIGRFRPRRPGGSGTFSNFELWAPEVAF